MMKKYRLNEPFLKGKEKEYVLDVLESSWLSVKGEHTVAFERKFAEMVGTKYALAVQSGTAALHTALLAMGVGKGDTVVIPNYTCAGCATSVAQCGATPVIMDVEPETFGLDADILEEVLEEISPKVVMPVHVYGFPARDIERIARLCKEQNILLLEDCSEAHSAQIGDRCVGTFGDIATFSVRSEKMIGVGEGGLILTDNQDLIDKAYYWASRAAPFRTKNDPYWKAYIYTDIGMNYLMPHLLGAVGHAQIENFDEILSRKRAVGMAYQRLLSDAKGIRLQKLIEHHNPVFWLNMVIFEQLTTDSVRQIGNKLIEKGIEIRPGFWPLGNQQLFQSMSWGKQDVGTYIFEHGIILPSSVYLADNDCQAVNEIVDLLLSML